MDNFSRALRFLYLILLVDDTTALIGSHNYINSIFTLNTELQKLYFSIGTFLYEHVKLFSKIIKKQKVNKHFETFGGEFFILLLFFLMCINTYFKFKFWKKIILKNLDFKVQNSHK